ncbi:hypothetical protein DL95DRAFT_321725, partial [Leptodontidium sp. 2 PMI_412]
MPTFRRPLAEGNTNITTRKELSAYIRGKTVGKAEEGRRPAHIAAELKLADSTVRDTIEFDLLRNDGASHTRTGQPTKYSLRFKRAVVNLIRKEPKSSFEKIRKHFGTKVSDGVIRGILKDGG